MPCTDSLEAPGSTWDCKLRELPVKVQSAAMFLIINYLVYAFNYMLHPFYTLYQAKTCLPLAYLHVLVYLTSINPSGIAGIMEKGAVKKSPRACCWWGVAIFVTVYTAEGIRLASMPMTLLVP